MGGVGAEAGLGREGEAATMEVGELEVGPAGGDGFGDVRMGTPAPFYITYISLRLMEERPGPASRRGPT